MTFGLDYLVWGMNPAGYHLTNVVLHAANAALFFVLVQKLLTIAPRATLVDAFALRLASAFAALLFAVHPLRVESVAWATERRDVLCGFFVLASLLAYLRHPTAPDAEPPHRWYWISLGLFVAAILSKEMAITLLAVLLPHEGARDVVVRLGVVGLEPQRFSIVVDRARPVSLAHQDVAPILGRGDLALSQGARDQTGFRPRARKSGASAVAPRVSRAFALGLVTGPATG